MNKVDRTAQSNKLRTSTEQVPNKHPTSTPQVPHKYPTNTPQANGMFSTDNPNIQRPVGIIGKRELSVKEIMAGLGLKDRKNVLSLYLNPALD